MTVQFAKEVVLAILHYYTEWHTATSSREILRLSRSQVTRPVTNYGQNFS